MAAPNWTPDGTTRHTAQPTPLFDQSIPGGVRFVKVKLSDINGNPRIIVFPDPQKVFHFSYR